MFSLYWLFSGFMTTMLLVMLTQHAESARHTPAPPPPVQAQPETHAQAQAQETHWNVDTFFG